MNIVRVAFSRVGIVSELFSFFWNNKRWWLVPILISLFVIGVLILLAQSSSIAPFIYTLF